jgi:hypothetical protein
MSFFCGDEKCPQRGDCKRFVLPLEAAALPAGSTLIEMGRRAVKTDCASFTSKTGRRGSYEIEAASAWERILQAKTRRPFKAGGRRRA